MAKATIATTVDTVCGPILLLEHKLLVSFID